MYVEGNLVFNFTKVPICEHPKYVIRYGTTTKYNRGFANKKEVNEWLDQHKMSIVSQEGGKIQWLGDSVRLHIVTQKGRPIKL